MTRARTVAEVIAGEAVSGTPEQRMADMRAIASVVANRAQMLGITPQEVVANSNEFNAYNRSLPPGVGQGIIDMAQEQIDYVAENGPVNNATFYATPAATGNLPSGLSYETETTGHQYFSDPQNRAIGSALGYIQPNQYGYAQNPANVPTPTSSAGLLSDWSQMAGVGPMTAPMGSVTASGLLGASPSLEASAAVTPMLSVPATADLGLTPGLSASSMASLDTPSSRMGLAEPSFDMSRFDGAAPSVASSFDQSRFGNVDTASFDPGRLGGGLLNPATNTQSFMDQPANLGSMPDAYAAQRGPSTGMLSADFQTIQGLAEKQLAENANTGLLSPSVASAYAAEPTMTPAQQAIADQTGGLLGGLHAYQSFEPAPGVFSAYDGPRALAAVQEEASQNLAKAVAAPMFNQALAPNIPAMATPANPNAVDPMVAINAQPSTAFDPKSLASPTDVASAIQSLAAPPAGLLATPAQQAAGYQELASSAPNITNLSGFTGIFDDGTGYQNAAPVSAQVPDLQTVDIADQPSVATVDGPATTPALEQQTQQDQQQAITAPSVTNSVTQTEQAPSLGDRLSKAINPGTIGGGLLGGLVAGPAGGLLGSLAGNGLYQNAGLLGSQPMTVNNIGGGLMNTASIWGGGMPAGTQATASDGQTVTSMGNGYTALTNGYGTTTVFDGSGKPMSYFGSALGSDQDQDTEGRSSGGGFFGGLFG